MLVCASVYFSLFNNIVVRVFVLKCLTVTANPLNVRHMYIYMYILYYNTLLFHA